MNCEPRNRRFLRPPPRPAPRARGRALALSPFAARPRPCAARAPLARPACPSGCGSDFGSLRCRVRLGAVGGRLLFFRAPPASGLPRLRAVPLGASEMLASLASLRSTKNAGCFRNARFARLASLVTLNYVKSSAALSYPLRLSLTASNCHSFSTGHVFYFRRSAASLRPLHGLSDPSPIHRR